jgi:hypothetical protein
MINHLSVLDLPGVTPRTIHERIIKSVVSKWEMISLQCFEDVRDLLEKTLADLRTEYFQRFQASGFLEAVRYLPCARNS